MNPGFTHSFIDPYWFSGKSPEQVDFMLEAGEEVGITSVIMQWSAFRGATGTVAAYSASPRLGFGTFNDAVPTLVKAIERRPLDLWMGLLVAPGIFSTTASLTDDTLLNELAHDTMLLADDLYEKFGTAIDGWHLPIEPNYKTITSPDIAARQGQWIRMITDHLHQHYPTISVMSSPSMPTAITAKKSPSTFVREFEPVMREAGIDVWNFQDGYKMTAWSPSTVAGALRQAKAQAARYDADVWAVMYTPGPGADGDAPITPTRMQEYMKAIDGVGIRLSQYMFTSYLNPDPTLQHGTVRAENYKTYAAYCHGD
ncbi:hypothetical protein ASE15_03445 [Oerskovia sp. Root22]|nr:hypothetical protein ASE15_03445 [Oerskovia sp. Root22]